MAVPGLSGINNVLMPTGLSIAINPVDVLASIGLQRDFNFEVRLPDIKGIPGMVIGQCCHTINFGQYNISDINTVRWGAFKKGYAGSLDIPPMRMTFYQPLPDMVSAYFTAWKSLVFNSRGLFYPKNYYARTVYVALFDRTGLPVSLYKLAGVFPKTYPAHRLSSQSSRIKEYEVEFRVDNYEDVLTL